MLHNALNSEYFGMDILDTNTNFFAIFRRVIYIVKKQKTTQPMTNTGQNIHEDTRTHNEK